MKKSLLLFLFFLGCSRNQLYVHIQNLDQNYLASSHVKTPDYRQKNPFIGQRLVVSWNISKETLKEGLSLYVTVRFFDNTQVIYKRKIKKQRGILGFYFENKDQEVRKKILTYKAEIYTKDMQLVKIWKHQFWINLIDVDK